jgi:hypothetical protein
VRPTNALLDTAEANKIITVYRITRHTRQWSPAMQLTSINIPASILALLLLLPLAILLLFRPLVVARLMVIWPLLIAKKLFPQVYRESPLSNELQLMDTDPQRYRRDFSGQLLKLRLSGLIALMVSLLIIYALVVYALYGISPAP